MASALEASYRKLEQKAAAARERLAAIIDATPDFVCLARPDGQVIHINRAGRTMWGIAEDESLSEVSIDDGFPPWAQARFRDEGLPILLREGLWRSESALLSRTGRQIPVSLVGLVHRGPDGSVEFLSTILRDISDLRRSEEERERFFSLSLDLQAVVGFDGD